MTRGCLILILFLGLFLTLPAALQAQCSICTKTAQQLGERPAKALNAGIIYLGLTPFLIIGYIGYRWWKNNQ
jgi:TRAP-type C4-dicarboxylate transport system permease small subunit